MNLSITAYKLTNEPNKLMCTVVSPLGWFWLIFSAIKDTLLLERFIMWRSILSLLESVYTVIHAEVYAILCCISD